MKKVLWLVLAALLISGMAVQADAMMCNKMKGMEGKGMGMGMHEMGMGMHEGPLMKHVMALGLDEKQKDAVESIHFRWKKDAIRKKAEIEVAGMELKEIMSKDPVDVKTAEQKVRQIESLKADMHIAHLKIHEEVKALLTPEQKKKLHSMKEMGPMGMGMGMGHMGGMDRMGCCMMMQDMGDDDDKPEPEKKPEAAPAAPAGHKHH